MTHTDFSLAKHLEQLKGGRFPIEVLVRGKDAAENEKLFIKLADKIKEAGVSRLRIHFHSVLTMRFRIRSVPSPKTPPEDPSSMSGRSCSTSNARM
jgi:hypothetical protein